MKDFIKNIFRNKEKEVKFGSFFNQVGIADGPNLDAFSRLRTSAAHSLFDVQFTYGLAPLLFEPITNGSGATVTHDSTNRNALMTFSSTPSGGKAYMQSFEHFRYVSGRSQLIFVTFNFIEFKASTVKFAGYSDGTNGVEFQIVGASTTQFVVYSATGNGNETVQQANWNMDKMDGTGPSGKTLDITKAQILVIDLQALYHGRVRIGFDIDGIIYYCHYFKHANLIVEPYIQTANLPVRCGMTCTNTVSTTMDFQCCTVQSEDGNVESEGYNFSQESGTITAASGARTHALSIQPRTTFNSIANRSKFIFEEMNVIVTGNNPVLWELCLGDVLTGTTTMINSNTTYSAVDYNILGTTSGAPAIVLHSGYVSASAVSKGADNNRVTFRYPICLDAAGAVRANGRLTLLVTGIGGSSTCRVSMCWKEIR